MKTQYKKKEKKILGCKEILFLSFMFGAVVIDIITKYLAQRFLSSEVILIDGFLRLYLVFNKGAGFGILQEKQILLVLIAIVVIGIIAFYYKQLESKTEIIGAALIAAGAFGNMVERAFFARVTDFIDLSFWPTFNTADMALSIGAVLLIISIIRK